jgi:hypothetical protein
LEDGNKIRMKWYAISGSWRIINNKVVEDVKKVVREIIGNGNGIVNGGALGVDYVSTQAVLDEGNPNKQLKIFLPIKLDWLCEHYNKRRKEGVITKEQEEMICSQLLEVKKLSPESILDSTNFQEANEESYYARNTNIVESCDVLLAFQVNDSKGTQDAIDKARKLGKEVRVKKYKISIK